MSDLCVEPSAAMYHLSSAHHQGCLARVVVYFRSFNCITVVKMCAHT